MNEESELNYMGIDQDGKFVCAASPRIPEADLAKELNKWRREGLRIERCSNEFVRLNFGKVLEIEVKMKVKQVAANRCRQMVMEIK